MAEKPARPNSAQTPAAQPKGASNNHLSDTAPRSPLTEFQEELCDLAGDIILRGAHPDDTRKFLYALLAHDYRRRFPDYPLKGKEHEEHVQKRVNDALPHWTQWLAKQWPEKPVAQVEPEVEQSVSEQVRSTARDDLRKRFETFMGDATPEEIRLLRDILMDQESAGMGVEGEVTLAHSFAVESGRYQHNIVVPWQHEQLVRDYIELLNKSGQRKAS